MSSFDFSSLPTISRVVDLTVYSRSALAATQLAFKEFCRVDTSPISNERLLVSVTPVVTTSDEVRTMILEFWNYYLDKSCQEKLG